LNIAISAILVLNFTLMGKYYANERVSH
jgi:hypothetical protein